MEPRFQSLKLGAVWSEGREDQKWEIWGWTHWFSPPDIVLEYAGRREN